MEPRSYLSQTPSRSQSRLLRDLYALNRQFVSLLLNASGDAASGGLLDAWLLARLATLSDPQIDKLAACPYSLFDLEFANPNAWREPPADTGAGAVAYRGLVECPDRAAFSLSALLFARELADRHADLARLLLGISNEVAQILTQQSLPTLAAAAFQSDNRLEARLARHAHFWPDLIDLVREGTRERYLAAQTLGVQQSASKL